MIGMVSLGGGAEEAGVEAGVVAVDAGRFVGFVGCVVCLPGSGRVEEEKGSMLEVEKWRCPFCGYENASKSVRCRNCSHLGRGQKCLGKE